MGDSEVIIGSAGGPSVVLRDFSAAGEGWTYLAVELHSDGLDVASGVSFHAMHPLSEFFRGLERDWRGWPDARTWSSTEPGLKIEARHTGRHVITQWTVIEGRAATWRATLEVVVEPGEELSRVARDIEDGLTGS